MKRSTDYTILALGIPFIIAVLSSLPGCYGDSKKQGANVGHSCKMEDCDQVGNISFKSSKPEGTGGYLFDLTHYNHPEWSYEQCEGIVKTYIKNIKKDFGN